MRYFILAVSIWIVSSPAYALIPGFFGVNLNGSLTTVTGTSIPTPLKTVHVNNKTITDAFFASGTTGVAKAGDLALVVNGALDLYVINSASNNEVIARLTTFGSSSTEIFQDTTNRLGEILVNGVRSDYEITLPAVQNVQITDFRYSMRFNNKAAIPIGRLLMTFAGGDGNGASGASFFQGTIKQNSKYFPP